MLCVQFFVKIFVLGRNKTFRVKDVDNLRRVVAGVVAGQIFRDHPEQVPIIPMPNANTIAGVASFGGKAAYIGKVADDELGRIFAHDIKASGVSFETKPSQSDTPTARSIVLVTPDAERTMSTYLGISPELNSSEVDPDIIKKSRILYLEGYLFDAPQAKEAFRLAASVAKTAEWKQSCCVRPAAICSHSASCCKPTATSL